MAHFSIDITEWNQNIDLTIHEITHVLLFSTSHYNYYVRPDGNILGEANIIKLV